MKGRPGPGPGFKSGGPMGPGIHGEYVVPGKDGGWQTMASQLGKVTAVDDSSITVLSEDGYSRTYSVDDTTVVTAGDNGIGDVKVDDQVAVLGVVQDKAAHAVRILDRTGVQSRHDQWAPPMPPKGPGAPGAPGAPKGGTP